MATYREVAERELIVDQFPSASIPQRSLLPELTTYFNRVVLHYYSETVTFRVFLLTLVASHKLQMLAVSSAVERTLFDFPPFLPRRDAYPTLTPWLQEALLELFCQPQFLQLELSFDFLWDSTVFCGVLLRNWLQEPEAFSMTTKSLKVLGAPSVKLLENYSLRTI
uniref:CYCLIN domain-containing protein n=1 Tax=Steinernema glaseri TaxID=37863 RepID=A0A1I8AEC8_9BILA